MDIKGKQDREKEREKVSSSFPSSFLRPASSVLADGDTVNLSSSYLSSSLPAQQSSYLSFSSLISTTIMDQKPSVTRWVEKYSGGGALLDVEEEEIEDIDMYTPLVRDKDGGENQKVGWRGRWEKFKRRAPYYVPSTQWLPKYQKSYLIHDIFAGLSVGVMLVPQALSYASLASLPGVYGLYTSCIPVMIYAFFSHSKELSVGPEVVSSILVGTTLKQIQAARADEPYTNEELAGMASVMAFVAGITTLAMGLVRFGFLSEILSRPLIRGFILAIALTIIVEQCDSMLGLRFPGVEGWRKIPQLFKHLSDVQYYAIAVGFSSLAFLVVMNFLKGRLPQRLEPRHNASPLLRILRTIANILLRVFHLTPPIVVVVVVGISITYGMGLDKKGLPVLGDQPRGLPIPVFPPIASVPMAATIIQQALVMSIIGFVVTMAIAKNFAAEKNYQVSANRELVALGVGNLCSSICLGYPGFGSLTRSVVNARAGVRTQLSGFVTSLVILFTLLFLMPMFKYLPLATNGSILVMAGVGLIDFADIIFLYRVRAWMDLLLLFMTTFVTFVFSASVGLLISIGASVFIVIRHTSVPRVLVLGQVPETKKFKDIDQFPEALPVQGMMLLRIEEALTFTNVNMLKEMMWRLEQLGKISAHPTDPFTANRINFIVLDIKNVPTVDPSAIQILVEMVGHYKMRQVKLCFSHLQNKHKELFLRSGLIQAVGPEYIFQSISVAVDHLQKNPRPVDMSSYQL